MERLGGLGVHTLEELQTFSSRVSPGVAPQAAPRRAPPALPRRLPVPRRAQRVLYVGTSRDLRTRVRSYFTASETRSRMGEMVGLAASVTGIECATPLEARGPRAAADRRAQAALQPAQPVSREGALAQADRRAVAAAVPGPQGRADDGADYLGPFSSRRTRREVPGRAARDVPDPPVQRPAADQPGRSPCVLAEMGRCLSPCDGSVDVDPYAAMVADRPRQPAPPRRRGGRGAHRPDGRRSPSGERFEEAGVHRDRLAAFVRAASRTQRLGALVRRAPSWSPRAARTTGAGRSTSYATAGWPPPA